MAISWAPSAVLESWATRLNSPFGYMLLLGAVIYIFLRISGKIGSPIKAFQDRRGGSGNSQSKQQADYIIRR